MLNLSAMAIRPDMESAPMFDPKSILEALVRGAGPQQPQSQGGGLGDILGQLGKAMGQPGAQGGGQAGGQGAGGLADILRQMVPQDGGGRGQAAGQGQGGGQGGGLPGGLGDILKNMLPGAGGQGQSQAGGQGQPGAGGGGLGDILGKLQEQLGRAGQGGQGGQGQGGQHAPGGQGAPSGGNLMDILGQILGQATQGVKEGAQRIDQSTGASGHARDMVGKATGQSPDDMLNQLKDLIAKHQMGAGAAAGGLGAVVLGTETGRAVAKSAIKLGALALIGGLAYKALQNFQQGKPLINTPQQLGLSAAPNGSGFEAGAVTNESAILYIRGMISAAAADGRFDADEQRKVLGGLQQAGLAREAEEFLANELNGPATVADLIAGVTSEQEAVQLFTAARIAIDLDTQEEHDFLVSLAQGLRLDGKLVAHIDAAARNAG